MIPRRLFPLGLGSLALLALGACGIQFGNVEDEYLGYSKPGASEAAHGAAVRECVFGRQGGGGTGRISGDVRDLRIEACLQQKGYHRG